MQLIIEEMNWKKKKKKKKKNEIQVFEMGFSLQYVSIQIGGTLEIILKHKRKSKIEGENIMNQMKNFNSVG